MTISTLTLTPTPGSLKHILMALSLQPPPPGLYPKGTKANPVKEGGGDEGSEWDHGSTLLTEGRTQLGKETLPRFETATR